MATVAIDGQTYKVPARGVTKGTAQMVLRPHVLGLSTPDQTGLTGQITYASYLGKEMQYTVETSIGSLFIAPLVQAQPFGHGDAVTVRIDAQRARLVQA